MGHELYEVDKKLDKFKEEIKNKLKDDRLPTWLEPLRGRTYKEEKQKALDNQDKKHRPPMAAFKINKTKAPEELIEKLNEWYKENDHIFDGYHCSFRRWQAEIYYENDKVSEIQIGADAHI